MPGPRPSPKIPPEPRPSIAWTVWYPVPCGSSQGLRKLSSRARRYGSTHAAARTRATPTPPAEASRRAGAPDTTSTPPSITATVIAVPRSGSARKRPQKAAVTRPTGLISSPSVRGVGCRERYAATQIRSASFASSDGWKTAGPISSQRLAPLTVAPTASTATRSAKEAASSVGASGRSGANRRGEVAAELVLVDRLRQLLRGCADQVGLCSPLAEIGGKLSVALVLSEPAEDDVERRVVRGDRAARGRGVRGLGVVDEPHTADLGHLLEPVRHAGKAAQRLGDPVVVDARGAGGGRRGGGVLSVVRARDARFGRQRIAATIQKRTMIFVSDHAFISKWWWIGAIRKIRRPQYLNDATWRITESALITKMPPMSRRSSSLRLMTANAPSAPPIAIEPVSPIITSAGKALYQRKPIVPPISAAPMIAMSSEAVSCTPWN